MSDWLRVHPHLLVLGADLDTWRDPVDLAAPTPGDDLFEEHDFVGPQPRHGLVDAFRDVLLRDGRRDELPNRVPRVQARGAGAAAAAPPPGG